MKAFTDRNNTPKDAQKVPEGARIVAYRCPKCGCGVMSAVDMLSLTRKAVPGLPARFKLRCANPDCAVEGEKDCGLTVEAVDDPGKDKVRVTFPCIICGGTHSALLSARMLASREFFSIPCPSYGVDIFFAGEIRRVKFELSKSELELLDMMGEGDEADISLEADKSAALPDPEISEMLTGTARLLEEEGKILCSCPDRLEARDSEDDSPSRLEFELTPHAVIVKCTRCGAKKLLPAVSYNAAVDFAEADRLILDE